MAFEGVRALAALTHPCHLLYVGSWDFAREPPLRIFKSFGHNSSVLGAIFLSLLWALLSDSPREARQFLWAVLAAQKQYVCRSSGKQAVGDDAGNVVDTLFQSGGLVDHHVP